MATDLTRLAFDVDAPPPTDDVAPVPEEPAAPASPEPGTLNGWDDAGLEALGVFWQMPYEGMAMLLGDHWSLSDEKSLRFARATARLFPAEAFESATGGYGKWLALLSLVAIDAVPKMAETRRRRRQKGVPSGDGSSSGPRAPAPAPAPGRGDAGASARVEDVAAPGGGTGQPAAPAAVSGHGHAPYAADSILRD